MLDKKFIYVIYMSVVVLSLTHCLIATDPLKTLTWTFCSRTEKVFEMLLSIDNDGRQVTVGMSWELASSYYYYAYRYGIKNVNLVFEHFDNPLPGADYYLLLDKDQLLIEKYNLKVERIFMPSGVILAKRL